MLELIQTYGMEVFAAIVLFTVAFFLGRFAIRKIFTGSTSIIKQDRNTKIMLLEIAIIFFAVLQATNASFAVSEAESHMEFILRFVSHMSFAMLSAIVIHGIWQEMIEAIVASKVLLRIVDDWSRLTWEYVIRIIFSFFIQWAQVVAMFILGLGCIAVNLWIMAKVTGEEQLFVMWWNNDIPFTVMMHKMSDRLFVNTVVSIIEFVGVITLGLLSVDTSLRGAGQTQGPRQTVQFAHMAGYMIKHLFGPTSGVRPNDLETIIKHDTTNEVIYTIRLEDAYVAATDADKLVSDRTKSAAARVKAAEQSAGAKEELKKIWQEIASAYTASTSQPTPPLLP